MFSKLNLSKIFDVIIGRQCWHSYIDSWKSWSEDWARNSKS